MKVTCMVCGKPDENLWECEQVYQIGERFFVPRIDSMYPDEWFDTLTKAWNYCEGAYYSWI